MVNGAQKTLSELFVYMNGVEVGRLLREPTGQLVFQYDGNWLNSKITRPVSLSMPLTEVPYKGRVVECYFETFSRIAMLFVIEYKRASVQGQLNVLICYHI